VAELEKYYGVALFDRIHQRLVLTKTGEELLPKAKSVLSEFADFDDTARHRGRSPKLRVGASLTLGRTHLPRFLSEIKKNLPEVEPSFTVAEDGAVEAALESGALDIVLAERRPESDKLRPILFSEERLLSVVAPAYPLGGAATLAELASHPLLLPAAGSAERSLIDGAFSAAGLAPAPLLDSVGEEALLAFAKAGHGIAILPEAIVRPALSAGELREISLCDATLAQPRYLLVHKSRRLSEQGEGAVSLWLSLCEKEETR
jgi:LysR family cys regulon transcriptional activator